MTSESSQSRHRRGWRFLPVMLLVFGVLLCFVGGASASLFELFAKSPEAQNSWLLLCGAPCGVVVVLGFIVFNLYTRFGRPLQELFDAINAVGEGNLAVRVPERPSEMFSDLIKRFNRMIGELERAEQQRRNLTADIAHELRTPLHIIQGNLEGIVDGVYQPTPEHINNTLDETHLLTRLANDLQTLSMAEMGQLSLHATQFALADLLQDVVTSYASAAAAQGISLETSLADPEQRLSADYDRLNQVLSNLVSNGLRHTPEGGTVSIRAEAEQAAPGGARLTVRDTGAGIAAEDLPFIFDRFWRGDRSRRERSHSGLGLAITRQLVLAHGGTIEAQSEVGRGTTFVIELPERAAV